MTTKASLYERITADRPGPHLYTTYLQTAPLDEIARTLFPHEARPLNWLTNCTRLHAPFQWRLDGPLHAILHDWDWRSEVQEFTAGQQARMREWARNWADESR